MSETTTEIAKFEGGDLFIDDHGFLMISGHFEYENSNGQGLGYNVNSEFIKRFMEALGAIHLKNCNGSIVRVTHDHSNIYKITPMFKQGKEFNILKWSEKLKRESEEKEYEHT